MKPGKKQKLIEYNFEQKNFLRIHNKIWELKYNIDRIEIIYKNEQKTILTENINVQWACHTDSQSFYSWSEFKLAQKQKYNIQNYSLILTIKLN